MSLLVLGIILCEKEVIFKMIYDNMRGMLETLFDFQKLEVKANVQI